MSQTGGQKYSDSPALVFPGLARQDSCSVAWSQCYKNVVRNLRTLVPLVGRLLDNHTDIGAEERTDEWFSEKKDKSERARERREEREREREREREK